MNFEHHRRERRIRRIACLICLLCFVISLSTYTTLTARASSVNGDILQVSIDIRPGKKINTIRINSKGSIPIAILSTNGFDATTVDPLTVQFGPLGAVELHARQHIKDANRDGKPDLLLHFTIRSAGIRCGDLRASLTGTTYTGQAIEGSDAIRVTGCKKIPENPIPRLENK